MGKGDKKTKRGKIHIGSYGVKRPKKKAVKKATAKKPVKKPLQKKPLKKPLKKGNNTKRECISV